MRFILKGPFKENIYNLMRKAGYHKSETRAPAKREDEQGSSTFAFCRPARGYPRFHIYLKPEKDSLIINLHLDQKKPIYKGAPAHSAEYQGKVVKEEAERIRQMLKE